LKKTGIFCRDFIEHYSAINARIGYPEGPAHAYHYKENEKNEKAGLEESVCHHP
jgi:hypothetical protein